VILLISEVFESYLMISHGLLVGNGRSCYFEGQYLPLACSMLYAFLELIAIGAISDHLLLNVP
jgi:hypothetical protein